MAYKINQLFSVKSQSAVLNFCHLTSLVFFDHHTVTSNLQINQDAKSCMDPFSDHHVISGFAMETKKTYFSVKSSSE